MLSLGKIAIVYTNKEEYDELIRLLDEQDYKWYSGHAPDEYSSFEFVKEANGLLLGDREDNLKAFGSVCQSFINTKRVTTLNVEQYKFLYELLNN